MIRAASTLPSSTPHWSNESMPQITPCVNTLCSYSATSAPSTCGVSTSARITFVGRLPSITRCGTTASARALGAHLVLGLAERERLGLREDVRRQDVVVVARSG